MTDRKTELKDKITKLLRKAAGTDNEHEAAVFLKKAKELMEEHQISSFDLGDDPFTTKASKDFQRGSPAAVKYELEASVARYFGCHPVQVNLGWGGKSRARMDLNGPESAILTHELMFPYIWKDVCRKAGETSHGLPGLKRSMIRDISNALRVRIDRLIKERESKPEVARDAKTDRALVVLGTGLSEYVKARYADLKEGKSRPLSYRRSAEELAGQVGLDRQVGREGQLQIGRG